MAGSRRRIDRRWFWEVAAGRSFHHRIGVGGRVPRSDPSTGPHRFRDHGRPPGGGGHRQVGGSQHRAWGGVVQLSGAGRRVPGPVGHRGPGAPDRGPAVVRSQGVIRLSVDPDPANGDPSGGVRAVLAGHSGDRHRSVGPGRPGGGDAVVETPGRPGRWGSGAHLCQRDRARWRLGAGPTGGRGGPPGLQAEGRLRRGHRSGQPPNASSSRGAGSAGGGRRQPGVVSR